MHIDIVDLRQFYATPLGRLAQKSISSALTSIWKPISDERLLGLGYSTPYLDRFRADAERTLSFMPAGQGGVPWPPTEPSCSALVFEEDLPLADASVDRVLMVHALEFSENAAETLAELWRVLTPGGRLIIVVPNRRGVWARMDYSPFGSGRPYSGGQLANLLRTAMFTPTAWSDALHFPPFQKNIFLKAAGGLERFGRRFAPAFAGVLAVEATKQIYQGLPVTERRSRRVYVPVFAPQGAAQSPAPRTPALHKPKRIH